MLVTANAVILVLPQRTTQEPANDIDSIVLRSGNWHSDGWTRIERPRDGAAPRSGITLSSWRFVAPPLSSGSGGESQLAVDLDVLFWPRFKRSAEPFAMQMLYADGAKWQSRRSRSHRLDSARDEEIVSLLISKPNEQRAVFYLYITADGVVTSRLRGRVDTAFRALTNRRTDVVLVRFISTPLHDQDIDAHQQRVRKLASEIAGALVFELLEREEGSGEIQ